MTTEFELIEHSKVQDIHVFLIEMHYRSTHLHMDIEVVYLLSGSLNIVTNNKKISLEKGDFLVLNSCQLHELHSKNSALLLIFQFSPKIFEAFFPQINEVYFDTTPIALENSETGKRLLENILLASQAYFKEEEYFSLLCHGFSSIIMFDLIKLVPHKQIKEENKNQLLLKLERIKRISDYISKNYQEKLLLSDIAKKEALSFTYLSHFFHENFGVTFQEYLNLLRCEKAKYLLIHTENTLLTICGLCGFSDLRYLNSSFKRFYGVSPKTFRKQQQNCENQVDTLKQDVTNKQCIFSKNQSLKKISQLLTL
ncbi:AraC family transcriptional regulator [Listeria grandensis FSL F6-0971]|uniref:AraC family transcriptional regulator n=1 Tax=Listeria grandensis FSL F6-0971 TaxID=1265819 RepID=W7BV50_9LIST|nr:AraC family transcriptional regulator [Listeria grandensis]EUJ24223.1 AraC family transcriptional regulator [Listeria grandensis FSL F6-0971]